ncbi:TRAP transporter small permease subunit [Bacillus sp. 1P02SD]|uniref:TRAP transporter small permease subunit n=1 Tax=Bacillus sp. 1P02SD TaxID=3132264 RepID=UPI0039A2BAEA
MRKGIEKISKWSAILSAILIGILMLSTTFDVISRSVTNKSLRGVVEISDVLLVAIVFLGMAYTQQTKAHVKMEVLSFLPRNRLSAFMRIIGLTVLCFVSVLLIYTTGQGFISSFTSGEFRTGLLSIPLWPSKFFIVFGFTLFFFIVLYELIDIIKNTFTNIKHDKSGSTKDGGISAK